MTDSKSNGASETRKDTRRITPETISFKQVARIAEWTDQPPFMIGFENSVCSGRYPILIARSSRHAQLLCDSLNDHFVNKLMMPRFGWLPENDFQTHESINIATSIRKAQTEKLRGEAAATIHSIAQEAKVVDETIADLVAPEIMSYDGPQPERFYVFVRLFPGLRVSSPWKEWVVLPNQDVENVMRSDARKWARENWDQVVNVIQERRSRISPRQHRKVEEPMDVERRRSEAFEAIARAAQQSIKVESDTEPPKQTGTETPQTEPSPPKDTIILRSGKIRELYNITAKVIRNRADDDKCPNIKKTETRGEYEIDPADPFWKGCEKKRIAPKSDIQ